MTCSPLLELTTRQLSPTNLHVLVHTAPGGGGRAALVPRPQQTFRRGKLIQIRLQHSADALSEPVPPPPVSPCCGRAAPRRLQSCCAQFAAEMGLALLDCSLSPPAPASGCRRRQEPATATAEWRSSTASSRLSQETWSSGCQSPSGSDAPRCRSPIETGSDDEPEPEPEPMWCQVPVALRGFRTPASTAQTGEDWLATSE